MKLSDVTPDMLRALTDTVRGTEVVAKADELFEGLMEAAAIQAQLGNATVSLSPAKQKEYGPQVMDAVNEKMIVRGFSSHGTGINPFGRNHGQKIYWWGW